MKDRIAEASAGLPRGWQADLARHCGVKPPSVAEWRSGKTKELTGSNLLLAADYFKVSPKWLSGRSRTKEIQTDQSSQSHLTPGALELAELFDEIKGRIARAVAFQGCTEVILTQIRKERSGAPNGGERDAPQSRKPVARSLDEKPRG